MPMILVADDSEIDRRIILEVLQKEPLDWLIEVVDSAEEAMHLMKQMAFDVIITDVLMSGLSGLELLNHVHKQPHRVPVIVISGQSDQQAAIDALRQGAASFVSKSELHSRLGETVKQVLDSSNREQNYQSMISCAQEMRFHFELENDPGLIKALVCMIQQMAEGMQILTTEAQTRLGVALDEAILNAMCHGNLELSKNEMKEVHAHHHADEVMEGLEKRRSESPFCDRRVHVRIGMTREGIKVIVQDDGEGFQTAEIAKGDPTRGITLIRNLVDQATFSEAGNELTLVKMRDRAAQSESASEAHVSANSAS